MFGSCLARRDDRIKRLRLIWELSRGQGQGRDLDINVFESYGHTNRCSLFDFPEGLEKPGKEERRGQRREHVKRVTSLQHVILVPMPCQHL